MRNARRFFDIYWLPSLFIGLGLLASFASLSIDHKAQAPLPNLFGLTLVILFFLSINSSRNKNIRLFFSLFGLFLAFFRLWWFFSIDSSDPRLAHWFTNVWIADFNILPITYAIGASLFFLFHIFEELYDTARNRSIWTSIVCVFIFSYTSIGAHRLFFNSGEGFFLYSLAPVQPYDAFFILLFTGYYILKSWLYLFRHWKILRISIAISAVGGALLATVATGIEYQIYNVTQNQMERKVVDITSALKKDVEERLSIISIFGDFLNTVPNPTESQIYGMMNKLNSSGMDAPAVLFFNQHFELKWIYQDNQFIWGRDAQKEILGRKQILVSYLQQVSSGKKYFSQQGPKGLSIFFSSPLFRNKNLAGYLVFEDLVQARFQTFFSKNDFGPFNISIETPDGYSLHNPVTFLKSNGNFKAGLDFLGEPLQLIISPNRVAAFNTVLIPQISFMAVGLLVVFFLVYTFYISRKRVSDVEKEVQDRIHDMKLLKEEADRAKLIAEHASYSKSQFLANMSHEIRTPLNVLLGASELLSETQLSSDQKKYVDMFQTSGKHLLGLLNDIIDLSRIESGQLETEKISFDLLRTLDFVSKLFSLKAQEQGLQFIVNTDGITDTIRVGDPLRIRQILVNLIGNSFKFTKQGTVQLTVKQKGFHFVQFNVEDTGVGIPDEKQKEIFETFQQGDVSFSRKHGGAGLGLAITKNLCELMGGSIVLQSQAGSGSKFIVQIPLPITGDAPVKVESLGMDEAAEAEIKPDASASTKNVLLVDDSDDNRFLVKLFLENSHFQITEAKNGEEAVNFVKKKPFDIILMDMQMPVMDGYEAVKIIRQFEEEALSDTTAKVPIIALTAHGTSLERNKCLEIGCTDYLSKPVSKNALLHRIADLMAMP